MSQARAIKSEDFRIAEMGVLQIALPDSSEVTGYGVNDTTSLEKDITAIVHMTFSIE